MQEAVTSSFVVAGPTSVVLAEGTVEECIVWARAHIQSGAEAELRVITVTVTEHCTITRTASTKSRVPRNGSRVAPEKLPREARRPRRG